MGFLDKLFGRKSQPDSVYTQNNNYNNTYNNMQNNYQPVPQVQPNQISSLNLNKEQSLKQLNLRKESIQSLCLEKRELNGLIARVCMVMDFSGSMDWLYCNGKVQEVIERLLPVAMQFDDNGVMEAWIFSNDCWRIKDISLSNYYNYIKNERLEEKYHMGGTSYAPVIQDVCRKYIDEEPADIPTLVLFITDGDNSDKDATTRIITKASHYPIFWQFVGIGSSQFRYLETLDEMEGRFIDNANFFSVNDLTNMNDTDLYNKLLGEYPDWIVKARNKGLLR